MVKPLSDTETVRFRSFFGSGGGWVCSCAGDAVVGDETLMSPERRREGDRGEEEHDDVGDDVEVRDEVELAALFGQLVGLLADLPQLGAESLRSHSRRP